MIPPTIAEVRRLIRAMMGPEEQIADPEQSAFVNGHTFSVDGSWYGDGSRGYLRRRKQNL